jgi:hypothetical protein
LHVPRPKKESEYYESSPSSSRFVKGRYQLHEIAIARLSAYHEIGWAGLTINMNTLT